jgi:uncharacterized secreted protein with C-terminal beta-propeller domain
MGVGEAIRSVRWFGDLATLVTFRQVDPFYVVDLSRPAQPRVLGELKVPGYSGYLHPVGDGRVLGVGRDGTPGGDLTGAQMSLFDVTDPARPRRLSRLSLGPSSADVERDHRTFAYLPEHRLAVLSGWFGRGLSAGPSVLGVRVGADGSLREVGHRRAARNIQRMLPVAGRLVLVSGTRVAVLDPVTFARLGRVDLRGS